MSTYKDFRAQRAAELDAAWHARYPNGMWYWYRLKAEHGGMVRCGRILTRPTSANYTLAPNSDHYLCASTYGIERHRTFDNEVAFIRHVLTNGGKQL